MPSTLKLVEEAVGLQKFEVLATAIDQLSRLRQSEGANEGTLDDQIAVLDLEELATQFAVTGETLRKNLCAALGKGAVFRVGKKWVIRKQRFLEYLRRQEMGSDQPDV